MKEVEKERLVKRVAELTVCTTPEEMSYAIWSKGLEDAVGSSRQPYRDGFVDWVKGYKAKTKTRWIYKTPTELVEAIWKPELDYPRDNDVWFQTLRRTLLEWIENYVKA